MRADRTAPLSVLLTPKAEGAPFFLILSTAAQPHSGGICHFPGSALRAQHSHVSTQEQWQNNNPELPLLGHSRKGKTCKEHTAVPEEFQPRTSGHGGYLVSFLLKRDPGALLPAWLHVDDQDLVLDGAGLAVFVHHLQGWMSSGVEKGNLCCQNSSRLGWMHPGQRDVMWGSSPHPAWHKLSVLTRREIFIFLVQPKKRSSRETWRSHTIGGSCFITPLPRSPPKGRVTSKPSLVKNSAWGSVGDAGLQTPVPG